jgi:hypothetical protein
VDDVLAAEWTDDEGKPLQPVAYSIGGSYGPILPRGRGRDEALAAVLAKLGPHAEAVESAYRALPEITHSGEYDWQAREREERRHRDCFALSEDDANAARAFGCLLELTSPDSRGEHRYVTDAEWLADRLAQKVAAHVAGEEERKQRGMRRPSAHPRATTPSERRAACSASATTKRGWRPARGTSTSAPRSPSGSLGSTRTPSSCSARWCYCTTAEGRPGRAGVATRSSATAANTIARSGATP